MADAWLGSPTASLERVKEQRGWFEDEWRSCGRGEPPPCPVIRECFVGTDASHAAEVSRGPLLYKYQAYASWGHRDLSKIDVADEFDAMCADRFVVGDAGAARESILRYAEELNSDHLLLRLQWPGLEQSEALGNIRRVGEVIASLGEGVGRLPQAR